MSIIMNYLNNIVTYSPNSQDKNTTDIHCLMSIVLEESYLFYFLIQLCLLLRMRHKNIRILSFLEIYFI